MPASIGLFFVSQASDTVAEEDFDISGLAAYLHMLPAQISKLADRGGAAEEALRE